MIVFSSHRGKAGSDARISSACEERYATVERWQVRVAACASPTAPCHVGVPCDLMLRGRTRCSTHSPFWLCVCQLDTFTPPWGLTLREGPVLNRVREHQTWLRRAQRAFSVRNELPVIPGPGAGARSALSGVVGVAGAALWPCVGTVTERSHPRVQGAGVGKGCFFKP